MAMVAERVEWENALRRENALIDWQRLAPRLARVRRGPPSIPSKLPVLHMNSRPMTIEAGDCERGRTTRKRVLLPHAPLCPPRVGGR